MLHDAQAGVGEQTSENDEANEDTDAASDGDKVEAKRFDRLLASCYGADAVVAGELRWGACQPQTFELVQCGTDVRILDVAEGIEPAEVDGEVGGREEKAAKETRDLENHGQHGDGQIRGAAPGRGGQSERGGVERAQAHDDGEDDELGTLCLQPDQPVDNAREDDRCANCGERLGGGLGQEVGRYKVGTGSALAQHQNALSGEGVDGEQTGEDTLVDAAEEDKRVAADDTVLITANLSSQSAVCAHSITKPTCET